MVAYLLLALAIAAEVTGTVSLKLSDGFSKTGPSIIVVAAYAVAFVALSLVLKKGIPVSIAYAIWAAAGVAAVALIGALFLDERLNLTMISGLVLVVAGVALLEAGAEQ